MMNGLGGWIRGIAGAAVVCGAALALTPKSKVKDVLKILCGVVIIIALLNPFINGESVEFSMDLSQYRQNADVIAGDAEKVQTNLNRSIIEQELNTYILDKAQTLGVSDLTVSIVLKWGDGGFWYPYEIGLISNAGPGERKMLSSFIEGELGIAEARQYWSRYEDEGAQNED